MLLGLIAFMLFWFTPSMRRLDAYSDRRDHVFHETMRCYDRTEAAENYDEALRCSEVWYQWIDNNAQPESGWNWPWAGWNEESR
jgi:hypothetical protein